jgi:hypothetical protein
MIYLEIFGWVLFYFEATSEPFHFNILIAKIVHIPGFHFFSNKMSTTNWILRNKTTNCLNLHLQNYTPSILFLLSSLTF